MPDPDLAYLSASELAGRIRRREISPVDVVEASLRRADALEPRLNAFVTRTPELALEAARRCERSLARGEEVGPLAGLPLSVKDLIDVEGVRTSAGSRLTPDAPAAADAPSVERARRAGAAIVGKTTTTEFGAKPGGGDSPLTGITRNAWDLTKTTGGSSAGSATSVAAGVTPFSITTDGGGSSRVPPALCGVFGMKCQFGRVPVFPVSAIPTLAHVGVVSRTVRDAALLLDAIAGYDARDPHSVPADPPSFAAACDAPARELRVAWSPTLGYARVTDEVRAITEAAARTFDELPGIRLELVEQVFERDPVDLLTAEFYAGAGVKMKAALEQARDLMDPVVAASLEPALDQTLEEYYGKVFARYALREHVRAFFADYDLLLSPTLPVAAFEAGVDVPPAFPDLDPSSWVYFTYPFNLTGNPAASIPCGFTDAGLPVGLQIAVGAYDEATLLRAAAAYEDATPWHDARPTLDD